MGKLVQPGVVRSTVLAAVGSRDPLPANRPIGYEAFTTFHPTFLYESLWNVAVIGLVLLVERQHRLRAGRLFAVYISGYALGRFLVERMRIDFAHTIGGLRVNEWTSIAAFAIAIGSPELLGVFLPLNHSPSIHLKTPESAETVPSQSPSSTDPAIGRN